MRIFLLSVFVTIMMPGWGQITITDNDMPSANDTFRISIAPIDTMDPELTGPGYTWNYTTLTRIDQRLDTFVNVTATPLAYQFFFNNIILYPNHKADYAIRGQNFALQAIQAQDVYDYYKLDASDYKQVGFGANLQSIPTSVRYDPIDHIYRFPMDYNNMDTSVSTYGFQIPGIGFYGQTRTRMNHVDGWGTLNTPNGSYNTLRVRSEIDVVDTVFVDSLGFGFNIPRPTQIEYKWLAQGEGVPVLKILSNVIITTPVIQSIEFRDDMVWVGRSEPVKEPAITVFPNPGTGLFNIDITDLGSSTTQITIVDAAGRLVQSGAITRSLSPIDISDEPAGTYFLLLQTQESSYRQPIQLVK